MALQNINTLQNQYFNNNIQDYYSYVAGVTNLGQRFGVKGDSITTISLSINQFFGSNSFNEDVIQTIVHKSEDGSYVIQFCKVKYTSEGRISEDDKDITTIKDYYLYKENLQSKLTSTSDLSLSAFFLLLIALYDEYEMECAKKVRNSQKLFIYFSPKHEIEFYTNTNCNEYWYTTLHDIYVECCVNKDVTFAVNQHVISQRELNHKFIVSHWADIYEIPDNDDKNGADAYDRYSTWKMTCGYDEDLIEPVNDFSNPDRNVLWTKLDVCRSFVLPFIGTDNYWYINGCVTSLQARGIDGNQPSFLVVHTFVDSDSGEISHELLTTIRKTELDANDWITEIATINDFSFGNNSTIRTREIQFSLPSIPSIENQYNLQLFLKNAIILNFADAECEYGDDKELAIELGKHAKITTFWVYDTTHDKFVPIENDGLSVDLHNLLNLNEIAKIMADAIEIDPDEYFHSWVTFDGIFDYFKNNDKTPFYKEHEWVVKHQLYPITMNHHSYVFTPEVSSTETTQNLLPIGEQYANEANFTIGFYNDISTNIFGRITNVSNTLENCPPGIWFDNDKNVYIANLKYAVNENEKLTIKDTFDYTIDGVIKDDEQKFYMPPQLEMSSILMRHTNLLNRLNFIQPHQKTSAGTLGYLSQSYIGTTYQSNNDHFIIGTSEINVDLDEHVIAKENINNFRKQNYADIDFYQTNIHGNTYFGVSQTASYNVQFGYFDGNKNKFEQHKSYLFGVSYVNGMSYTTNLTIKSQSGKHFLKIYEQEDCNLSDNKYGYNGDLIISYTYGKSLHYSPDNVSNFVIHETPIEWSPKYGGVVAESSFTRQFKIKNETNQCLTTSFSFDYDFPGSFNTVSNSNWDTEQAMVEQFETSKYCTNILLSTLYMGSSRGDSNGYYQGYENTGLGQQSFFEEISKRISEILKTMYRLDNDVDIYDKFTLIYDFSNLPLHKTRLFKQDQSSGQILEIYPHNSIPLFDYGLWLITSNKSPYGQDENIWMNAANKFFHNEGTMYHHLHNSNKKYGYIPLSFNVFTKYLGKFRVAYDVNWGSIITPNGFVTDFYLYNTFVVPFHIEVRRIQNIPEADVITTEANLLGYTPQTLPPMNWFMSNITFLITISLRNDEYIPMRCYCN